MTKKEETFVSSFYLHLVSSNKKQVRLVVHFSNEEIQQNSCCTHASWFWVPESAGKSSSFARRAGISGTGGEPGEGCKICSQFLCLILSDLTILKTLYFNFIHTNAECVIENNKKYILILKWQFELLSMHPGHLLQEAAKEQNLLICFFFTNSLMLDLVFTNEFAGWF